jgi:hypothetical protein
MRVDWDGGFRDLSFRKSHGDSDWVRFRCSVAVYTRQVQGAKRYGVSANAKTARLKPPEGACRSTEGIPDPDELFINARKALLQFDRMPLYLHHVHRHRLIVASDVALLGAAMPVGSKWTTAVDPKDNDARPIVAHGHTADFKAMNPGFDQIPARHLETVGEFGDLWHRREARGSCRLALAVRNAEHKDPALRIRETNQFFRKVRFGVIAYPVASSHPPIGYACTCRESFLIFKVAALLNLLINQPLNVLRCEVS